MAEREVVVNEVRAFKTQAGNTRFVLRADDGTEYTTFKETIGRSEDGEQQRMSWYGPGTSPARTELRGLAAACRERDVTVGAS